MGDDYYADDDVYDEDNISVDQIKLPKNKLIQEEAVYLLIQEEADSDNINVKLCRSASLVAKKSKPRIKARCLP